MFLGVDHCHTQFTFVNRCATMSQVVTMNIAVYDSKNYLAVDLLAEATNSFYLYEGF